MRLFWKDQLPLLLFYLLQMLLVPSLYWLTGEDRPLSIMLYGIVLSTVVLLLYLGYRYVQYRKLYVALCNPTSLAHEHLVSLGEAPLSEAIHELLQLIDRQYQEEVNTQVRRMDHHVVFMNRWVHQMKTPLSVIQLTLQDLEDEAAGSIQEELERLRKGLEMVIYTSRLDRFEEDFQVEPLLLRKAVNEAIAENRKLFIRRSIKADIQVDANFAVYSDAKWLMFILGQILTNAVNYTTGTGKRVTISAQCVGSDIILDITDQGIGISPEDLKRVFNPYFTGERGRQYHESTGMGLYLVQEVCKRLGHKVELQSKLSEGTTVRLSFSNSIHLSNDFGG
ncbi:MULTISPECIES: sensor histidine kinase [unclassified Paenibacillus]|uniref:sensor histidine kinase n=1 Tax=unclassified Paenibacillus TaxID=185978 RepID=UPI002405CF96|nr:MULTISPECIES: sensor histidine kinase [unclassified Paenibacillus]MDF9840914.1 OmpR family two-component system sensor histidine kinase YxdK [Paenibacillus sp. PastF-2]MDF9847498.1 OmpR family two-component system sensor histidine kinase YxdK [Paenibacillus sp. PastM-2]MDF9853925.1 OmpR family two-component system sensor histidine kinase YxdK [Paenibacillus sp. PastF-1]MDH6479197.1 OmpR family two-component system sensor histidine kinase YxdK [Paenibacillus sp. PastH-2]MDH6507067.1 OmpR fam